MSGFTSSALYIIAVYGRAGTQNARLAEAVILSTGTSIPVNRHAVGDADIGLNLPITASLPLVSHSDMRYAPDPRAARKHVAERALRTVGHRGGSG